MNRKKIGIAGWVMGTGFGVTLAYVEFFQHFGDVHIINPNEKTTRDIDLLVLPGGPDIDVCRYLSSEESISMYISKPCPFREWFDMVLLPKYMKKKVPIFGICRGHQSFAAINNGHLIQNMWHETNENNRSKKVHNLDISLISLKKFGLESAYSFNYKVNSIHHQAIDIIPENAISLAVYKGEENDTKHNEALGYIDYPAFTVQWHPEELGDCELSIAMIEKLLDENYYKSLFEIENSFKKIKIPETV